MNVHKRDNEPRTQETDTSRFTYDGRTDGDVDGLEEGRTEGDVLGEVEGETGMEE